MVCFILCSGLVSSAASSSATSSVAALDGSMRTRGVILLERHVEKNGGTSFRDMIYKAERAGHCMYWGWMQRSTVWAEVMSALDNLTADAVPPQICIEAHNHIDYQFSWLERMDRLAEVRKRMQVGRMPRENHVV